jgi:NAD(P)-dependent dehydrogenase (short-subunit alcohol dehydrogenase family)
MKRFQSSRMRRGALRKVAQVAGTTMLVGGVAAGVAVGLGARAIAQRRQRGFDLRGKVVVITGGSRGLGLALAEECARSGARIAICARDERELLRATETIEHKFGVEVLQHVCDVALKDEVDAFINLVLARFGRIDVLINNAGIITVGPQNSQTLTDYQESMDVMFWGTVYAILAVLPHMQSRREGRIANITSFAGKVALPHLVPYCSAKFAAVGFSKGMRAELLRDGVKVTTVCPGLMRTGSHLNAYFKGENEKEFRWFMLGASLPLISIDARRAARKIVHAIQLGQAELVITPQAKLALLLHGIFPGLTSDILGVMNRLLPDATDDQRERHLGKESETTLTRSFVTRAGRKAAEEFHQQPKRGLA